MSTLKKSPVVLLTDFGDQDAFVGILKGVIAAINPEANVIDLSHGIRPQDLLQASFLLSTSCSYFPEGTVFCVVVDPGVGSERKGICIQTRDYYFVGPDNGVMWKAANDNNVKKMIHLDNETFFLDSVSPTFHGRDIFAPVTAHISLGLDDISVLGEPVSRCIEYHFPKIEVNSRSIGLTVIHIDRFGNLVLNLDEKEFNRFVQHRPFCLTINNCRIRVVRPFYARAEDGEFFLIAASSSHMEISVKNASAADQLNVKCGDKAELTSSAK